MQNQTKLILQYSRKAGLRVTDDFAVGNERGCRYCIAFREQCPPLRAISELACLFTSAIELTSGLNKKNAASPLARSMSGAPCLTKSLQAYWYECVPEHDYRDSFWP